MFVERPDDRLHHVAMGAAATLHVNMRLLVGLTPLVRKPLQRRFGVAVPQLRAGVAARRPLGEDIDRRIEPHRNRPGVQKLPRARIDIGAAAGGDDPHLAFDEPCDQPPLAVAEIVFAIALENLGGRQAGGVLDGGITVDEWQAEPLRETAPDGRFSYAHQSDQHDGPVETFPQICHAWGYTAAHGVGKSGAMSRLVVLIVILVIIAGGLVYLSTVPKAQPTHTIEVAVPQGATSGGNAH